MASIALFTSHVPFPWLRQMPESGIVNGFRVTLNEMAEDCAFAVVYDEPPQGLFSLALPRDRLMVVLSEPPGMKRYQPGFLNQFGHVMGPIEPEGFTGQWHSGHPALPWFYGVDFADQTRPARLDLVALASLPVLEKREALSVVISKKAKLPKHRARLRFVEALEKRLGDRLHVFGRGFHEIADKAEAISPFAYHLVLENNDLPSFWTEKLADAYLGWALPIFSGCANLEVDFPAQSFVAIDIAREAETLDRIEAMLESGLWSKRLPAISKARVRLLTQHNLFTKLAEWAATRPITASASGKEEGALHQNAQFLPLPQRLIRTIRLKTRNLRKDLRKKTSLEKETAGS